jgi:hypothetical protein
MTTELSVPATTIPTPATAETWLAEVENFLRENV